MTFIAFKISQTATRQDREARGLRGDPDADDRAGRDGASRGERA
jgi:hypothetical protein